MTPGALALADTDKTAAFSMSSFMTSYLLVTLILPDPPPVHRDSLAGPWRTRDASVGVLTSVVVDLTALEALLLHL